MTKQEGSISKVIIYFIITAIFALIGIAALKYDIGPKVGFYKVTEGMYAIVIKLN